MRVNVVDCCCSNFGWKLLTNVENFIYDSISVFIIHLVVSWLIYLSAEKIAQILKIWINFLLSWVLCWFFLIIVHFLEILGKNVHKNPKTQKNIFDKRSDDVDATSFIQSSVSSNFYFFNKEENVTSDFFITVAEHWFIIIIWWNVCCSIFLFWSF